jgi:hypothetical protein
MCNLSNGSSKRLSPFAIFGPFKLKLVIHRTYFVTFVLALLCLKTPWQTDNSCERLNVRILVRVVRFDDLTCNMCL